MKLSVILPCFNGAKTIALQLEALAHQCWSEPWELVVVNNRSTDRSMQIVQSYRNLLPNLQIYSASGGRLVKFKDCSSISSGASLAIIKIPAEPAVTL